MSYTVATPGGKVRPAVVTAASALLYLVAGIEVISLVLEVLSFSPTLAAYDDVYAGDSTLDTMKTVAQVTLIVTLAVTVLFAAGIAALGMLISKGKNPARIVTWVVAGLGVLCFGCALGLGSYVSSLNAGADAKSQVLQKQIEGSIPSWQSAVSTGLGIVVLLALVAVVILLALPAANEFFRKEQEVWVPPTDPGLAGFPPPVPQQTMPSTPEAVSSPLPSYSPEPSAATTAAPEPPSAPPATPPAAPPSDPPASTPPSAPAP